MNRLFLFLPLLLITVWTCNNSLNGTLVNGFYSEGITGPDGKNYSIPGYDAADATVFYLVRHAEKASGSDPELTPEGTARAKKLGTMLKNVELDGIYSTNFKRTKSTAAPTAELQTKKISIYDHKKLQTLVDEVSIQKGKKFLIVGHSNTTPDLLNLFQLEKVYDHIDEKIYDNFYIVILNKNGKAKILKLKY